MAIKKRFIGNQQVDGTKIKLLKNQAIKGENQAGQEIDLLKLGLNDEALVNGVELASKAYLDAELAAEVAARVAAVAAEASAREAADAAKLIEAKQYADGIVATEASARQAADTALDLRLTALEGYADSQIVYVAKNGSDATATGGQHKPFATVGAALAAITDASPTKRYLIKVGAGAYSEGAIALKANVFIAGEQKEAVRITATSFSLASDFTGSGDHRSGMSQVILIGAADFNWQTVTSAAGKLYFNEVSFNNNVSMYGHNNATAQAQFDSCLFFGNLTLSGINLGIHNNNFHYGNIVLNQHPNGGMATILAANGGACQGSVTLTTTVTDFNRRAALFARNFWMGALTVNGASSYADVTDSSLPSAGATIQNGGNLIRINPQESANKTLSNLSYPTAINQPLIPATSSTTNLGDWGKQWMWNFGYVHASTGSDAFFGSYPASFGADTSGKSVTVRADLAGLAPDANGGNVILSTSAVSGTGVRGKVTIDARELDMSAKKITNVADGVNPQDAVTKAQLDAVAGAVNGEIDGRLDTLESQVGVLNGNASVEGSVDQKVSAAISAVVNSAPETFDTLKEIADWIASDETATSQITSSIADHELRLDTLEGADTVEGSVAKAEKDAKDYADAAVAAEAALRQSADSTLDGKINQEISDRASAVSAEATARQAADDALDVRLDVLEGADTVEGSVAKAEKDAKDYADSAVAAEALLRESADSALDARLDVLEGADTVEGSVAKAEADAKAHADTAVAAEAVLREAADDALAADITAEESRALAAEGALDDKIDEEISDRIAAVSQVASDLSTETSARIAGDEALDTRLDVLEGPSTLAGSVDNKIKAAVDSLVNGASSLYDTLKEVEDYINSDVSAAAAVTSQLGDHETRIDTIEANYVSKAELLASRQHKRIVLTATNISNGYVDVDHTIVGTPTVMMFPDRLTLLPTDDYTVSGARITWNVATVGPGGFEELIEGDVIHVYYNK